MNNNRQFDEKIKAQFSEYVPEVHPRIWENIVAEKRRRKPAGYWLTFMNTRNMLVSLGLILAIGGGIWILLNGNAPLEGSLNKTSELFPNNKQSNTGLQVMPANTDPNSQDRSLPKHAEPFLNNKSNPSVQTDQADNTRLSSSRSRRLAQSINISFTNPSAHTEEVENTQFNNKKINKSSVSPSNMNLNTDKNESVPDDLSQVGSLFGRLMYQARKLSHSAYVRTELQQRKVPSWLLPDCPSMEKNAAGNKKYLEFYGGPDIVFRIMRDTGNSVYLQKRKESSNVSSAFSAGVRFTKVFNNSVSIRTGVNYSQINEKFNYVAGNLVQITYIIDANGDTTGSYITRGTRYKTTYNKYRSIDIPLLVGYEVGNGKIHANINAGPVMNIYSWQKGEVLDTALKPVSITTGKGSSPYQFKTNAGIGFIASASIYYKLNENVHLMAEPYYRYNLSQLNKENLTLKQKFNTAGIRLGIRMDLK